MFLLKSNKTGDSKHKTYSKIKSYNTKGTKWDSNISFMEKNLSQVTSSYSDSMEEVTALSKSTNNNGTIINIYTMAIFQRERFGSYPALLNKLLICGGNLTYQNLSLLSYSVSAPWIWLIPTEYLLPVTVQAEMEFTMWLQWWPIYLLAPQWWLDIPIKQTVTISEISHSQFKREIKITLMIEQIGQKFTSKKLNNCRNNMGALNSIQKSIKIVSIGWQRETPLCFHLFYKKFGIHIHNLFYSDNILALLKKHFIIWNCSKSTRVWLQSEEKETSFKFNHNKKHQSR